MRITGNTGWRNIANLQEIIDRVKTKYPGAKLIMTGMQVPPIWEALRQPVSRQSLHNLPPKIMALVPLYLKDGRGGWSEPGWWFHLNRKKPSLVAQNICSNAALVNHGQLKLYLYSTRPLQPCFGIAASCNLRPVVIKLSTIFGNHGGAFFRYTSIEPPLDLIFKMYPEVAVLLVVVSTISWVVYPHHSIIDGW